MLEAGRDWTLWLSTLCHGDFVGADLIASALNITTMYKSSLGYMKVS